MLVGHFCFPAPTNPVHLLPPHRVQTSGVGMTGFTRNSLEFGGLLGFGEPTAQRPCYFRLTQRRLGEMTTRRGKEHFSQLRLSGQKELQS